MENKAKLKEAIIQILEKSSESKLRIILTILLNMGDS